ncbi:MAG: riboflavin synthase [Saprospiraceae bacterium]|nr:riboflavin synthase [Saprospiraceae bacterium]
MFTGIIEDMGKVSSLRKAGTNVIYRVTSPISHELKVDQSLAHDGVCLTVIRQEENWHEVEAVQETLNRTALGKWQEGTLLNLERALKVGSRLDGHMVQGHVDAVGKVDSVESKDGSWVFAIRYPLHADHLVIDKGSIAINGISLTVINPHEGVLTVSIIPYTFEHTNLKGLVPGDDVNLEFDMVGKYIARQRP